MKNLDFIGKTQRKDTKASVARSYDEALKSRRREFWHPILTLLYTGYERHPDAPNDPVRQKYVREDVLKFLNEGAAGFAKGNCPLPLAYDVHQLRFKVIMFIVAFDMRFNYTPADPEDPKEPVYYDNLPGEAAFQVEVRTALDKYILEGAKLAKKVGSVNYLTWTNALIMLGDLCNDRYDKCEIEDVVSEIVQLIVEAQQQLWADVRVSK